MLPDEAGLILTNVSTSNNKFGQTNLSLVQAGSVSQEHLTNMPLLITTSIRKKKGGGNGQFNILLMSEQFNSAVC